MQDLAQRLRRLEAVTGGSVIRHAAISSESELTHPPLTKHHDRLAEQPAQLLDRDRLPVVLREVHRCGA